MARTALEPRQGPKWRNAARALIHRLEDGAPVGYDGHRIAPYRVAYPRPSDDFSRDEIDLVRRLFRFRGDRLVVVRLQRVAFVGLLRAMRDEPSIEIGFGAGFYATYRTDEMQGDLREIYLNGGPLAAPQDVSNHELGIAADLSNAGASGSPQREAMQAHGFQGLLPQDPPHHTFGRRG